MEFIIKANLLLLIFFLFYKLILKRHTFFNTSRWFLISGMLLAILLPFFVIPNYIYYEPVYINTSQNTDVIASENLETVSATSINYGLWIVYLYLAGIAFFLIKLLIDFKSLFSLISASKKHKKNNYTLVQSNRNIAPFSFFKWIVLNPKQFNKEELSLVLQHEQVHVQDYHTLDVMLSQLLCILFWFNPVIWLYKRELQQNLEFIADRQVHQQSEHKQLYQTLLLKTSIPHHELVFTNTFYNSIIKKRIVMLHKSKSKQIFKLQFLFIIPILTVFLLNMNTKDVFVPIEKEPITTENDTIRSDIKVTFNKHMSQQSLNEQKEFLKQHDVLMIIKKISRNDNNEITEINVDFKTANGIANYNIEDPNGIQPFYFEMSKKNGSFGVGALAQNHTTKQEETHIEALVDRQIASFLAQTGGTIEELLEFYKKSSLAELKEEMLEINKRMKLKDTILMNLRGENDSIWVDSFEKGYNNVESDSIITNHKTPKTPWTMSMAPASVKEHSINTKSENDSTKKAEIKSDWFIDNIKNDINASNISFNPHNIGTRDMVVYMMNGKIVDASEFRSVKPDAIKSIEVIKKREKLDSLGFSGKDGLIKLKTHALSNHILQSSPNHVVYYKVNSVSYVDDDTSNNDITQYIYKETSDEALDQQIKDFEKVGVTMSYSKLRRNKSGHITNIKVNLKNNTGQEIEDTFSEKDGAVVMEYGLSKGKLKISKLTE